MRDCASQRNALRVVQKASKIWGGVCISEIAESLNGMILENLILLIKCYLGEDVRLLFCVEEPSRGEPSESQSCS